LVEFAIPALILELRVLIIHAANPQIELDELICWFYNPTLHHFLGWLPCT
jgi:hypothetical protein